MQEENEFSNNKDKELPEKSAENSKATKSNSVATKQAQKISKGVIFFLHTIMQYFDRIF
jgi:hypothetical protein